MMPLNAWDRVMIVYPLPLDRAQKYMATIQQFRRLRIPHVAILRMDSVMDLISRSTASSLASIREIVARTSVRGFVFTHHGLIARILIMTLHTSF